MSENQNTTPQTDRPTHEIQTRHGHTIVLLDYITGREEDEINNIYMSRMQMKQKMGGKKQRTDTEITGLTGDSVVDAERKTIEKIVVAVDGETDRILDRVLDLRSTDRGDVRRAIDKVTGDDEEDPKGSGGQ